MSNIDPLVMKEDVERSSDSSNSSEDAKLSKLEESELRRLKNGDIVPPPRNTKALWACTWITVFTLALLLVAIGVSAGLTIDAERNGPPNVVIITDRTWFIAAEPIYWTFAPKGDVCHEGINGVLANFSVDPNDVEATVYKGHYVQYTDATFSTKVDRGPDWEHEGLLGPTLFVEAGDSVTIHLRNSLPFAINFEPNGAMWTSMDGLLTEVGVNRTVSYRLKIFDDAGPEAGADENSKMYFYHSTINPTTNDNTGLVGAMIVSRKGEANPDGTPKGIDRTFVSVFQIYFELESNLNYVNAEAYVNSEWNVNRYTINGFAWCNLNGLRSYVGEKVQWHIGSIGSENGLHNFHWHGNTLKHFGHHMDQFMGLPGTSTTAEMSNDNPGKWLFHCHVNTHLDKGMVGTYEVIGPKPELNLNGHVVEMFIAADKVVWNYAPQNGSRCNHQGTLEPFSEEALMYVGDSEGVKIGSQYLKAQFREYTDATFTTIKERPIEEAYLGLLGPTIRAKVGDVILIHFRNNLEVPATLHPHGVIYNKSSEGAPYNDGTPVEEKKNDAVPPGEEWTYEWHVPDRAGPGPKDESSMIWMYHSHADETRDTWAGLVGAIIITGADTPVNEKGVPLDVDVELIIFFSKVDETVSFYIDENIERFLPWVNDTQALYEDVEFLTSSLHHSVNFFMYCNMPAPNILAGSNVRFHIMTLGDETDMHAPNLGGGGSFLTKDERAESLQLVAGSMKTVKLSLSSPGHYEIECGVQDHYIAGMAASYNVLENADINPGTPTGRTRTYYIQAQQEEWDYSAGKEYTKCTLRDYSFKWDIFMTSVPGEFIGSKYQKAFYRQYTDQTFRTRTTMPDYQGMLGPLISAEVGDNIVVVFKNALDFAVNLAPGGGLLHDRDESGAVEPGTNYTYRWFVPDSAGPSPNDLSSIAFGYSSTVDPAAHQQLGLVGLVHIGRQGTFSTSDATNNAQLLLPEGVDHVVPLLWEVFNENASPLLNQSMIAAGMNPALIETFDPEVFEESNMQHGINGFMYCTMPNPTFRLGSKIRWVFLSIGSEEGSHSPFFTGQLFENNMGPDATIPLVPYQARVLDMTASQVGDWPFWCQVHDHVEAGMMAAISIVA